MTSPPFVAPQRVTVVDFDISFGNMVMLLVKISIASIPALLILMLPVVMLVIILGTLART